MARRTPEGTIEYDPVSFTCDVLTRDGAEVTVFQVKGDLRDGAASPFLERLGQEVRRGANKVELEFEGADYVGVMTISLFVQAYVAVKRRGGSIRWNWSRSSLRMIPEDLRRMFGDDDGMAGVLARLRHPPTPGVGGLAKETPEDDSS